MREGNDIDTPNPTAPMSSRLLGRGQGVTLEKDESLRSGKLNRAQRRKMGKGIRRAIRRSRRSLQQRMSRAGAQVPTPGGCAPVSAQVEADQALARKLWTPPPA